MEQKEKGGIIMYDDYIVTGFTIVNNIRYVMVAKPSINQYGVIDFNSAQLVRLDTYNDNHKIKCDYDDTSMKKLVRCKFDTQYVGFNNR